MIIAVGGGGLFAGTAATANYYGIKVVAVEPSGCCALAAAIAEDRVVDVPVESVAADALGARRVSTAALEWTRATEVTSLLVDDEEIVRARRLLWEHRRLAVELGAATALAALTSGVYQPYPGEKIAVVLCGANTDPSDLLTTPR